LAKPTIIEVARAAGVSIATVSRCLNAPDKVSKKTLGRVRSVISELQYSPNLLAQNFRRGKTGVILVVVHDIGNWVLAEIVEGIRLIIGSSFSIIIAESRTGIRESNNAIDMLLDKQVEGIILLCSLLPFDQKIVSDDNHRYLPIVVGLEPLSEYLNTLPSVHIDNHQAALDATNYIIGLGHRNIVFISGQRHSYVTKDRESGFVAAMKAAGLPLNDGSVLHSDLSVNGGVNAAHSALGGELRPTAIFCANDDMALGAMSAAHRRGFSIPDDLSIMGFDDMRYAAVAIPSLSTVAQPTREIGMRAAERLISMIENQQLDGRQSEILPHRLVIRSSTGRLVER